ncbi:amino acid ABC transporter permease [Brucellaceae bacterium C25G]
MTQTQSNILTKQFAPELMNGDTRLAKVQFWLKTRIFGSVKDTIISLLVLVALCLIIWTIIPWALIHATWIADSRAQCSPDGACWAFVLNKGGQFIYGFYPPDERWRANIVFILLVVSLIALMVPKIPGKKYTAVFTIFFYPFVAFFLLYGGIFDLKTVATDKWGGLLLTLVLAVSGITFSLPVGVFLALGRRSQLPLIKWFCIGFIEFCRGVPFVTVLFMAIVMLPFFLPSGLKPDALALAVVGIIFYEAAYMAEVVRGGLQAIPKGQYESAMAVGFGYWRMMLYIILPQALRKVIPGIVNTTISLLKNTTLVMIVGLFDLLNIVSAGASDPIWVGSQAEGYFLVGLVFWLMSFGLSYYSRTIESKFAKADQQ